MEFDININGLLRDEITKVDSRLQVCRNAGSSYPEARMQLFEIINKMGEASARAQGLAGAITTGRRLETSDHHLYIMKDSGGTGGKGAVIGVLKMGRKRLFVYDRHGQQWEMNPLCVLDFYVHESRQRMGCGRRLFDYMLKGETIAPQHLAVDRPSLKFSSFLTKHYGLRTEIPQVNNFVIFEGFFTEHPDGDYINNKRTANMAIPADYPSRGGETPTSWPATNNHTYSTNKLHNYPRANTSMAPLGGRPPSSPHTKMAAAGLPSMLPRHQAPPFQGDNSLKELNLNPRSAQTLPISGSRSPRCLSDAELRSVSASIGSTNQVANLQLHSTMYSRHQTVDTAPSHPHYTTAQRLPTGNVNSGASDVVRQRPPPGNVNSGASDVVRQRPPSGNRRGVAERENAPPMLQREGPPRDYLESFNLHQNYQGRAGHLLVPGSSRGAVSEPAASAATSSAGAGQTGRGAPSVNTHKPSLDNGRAAHSHGGGYYTNPALYTNADTSWTVFGVMRRNQYNAGPAGRTRLW